MNTLLVVFVVGVLVGIAIGRRFAEARIAGSSMLMTWKNRHRYRKSGR